jgi:hypothetical protein
MRYSPAMRWFVVLVAVVVAGCTPTWERHQTQLAEAEAHGDYIKAVSEQRWLIDNAFEIGPRSEHTFEADARRYRHLAKLAAKTGNYALAVDSLKQALAADPSQAAAVRRQLDALPLSPKERAKLDSEFSWNMAALQPGNDTFAPDVDENTCWSYRVSEVRVRHPRTVSTPNGMQRQVTYDARAWVFDSDAQRWRADGGWVEDAGTETEWIDGPNQPRYRALATAGSRFYTDGKVPPCHRSRWQGPFDANGTVFVAEHLPEGPPASH